MVLMIRPLHVSWTCLNVLWVNTWPSDFSLAFFCWHKRRCSHDLWTLTVAAYWSACVARLMAVFSLFVTAPSPLHGRCTLRTIPLPLRSLRQADTAVMKPLDGTLKHTHYLFIYICAHTQIYIYISKIYKINSRPCCHSRPFLHKKPGKHFKQMILIKHKHDVWIVDITATPHSGWSYLVTDAVSGLVGVVGPVYLTVGLGLGQRWGLLGKFLSQCWWRGAGRQRGRGGRRGRLMVGWLDAASVKTLEKCLSTTKYKPSLSHVCKHLINMFKYFSMLTVGLPDFKRGL